MMRTQILMTFPHTVLYIKIFGFPCICQVFQAWWNDGGMIIWQGWLNETHLSGGSNLMHMLWSFWGTSLMNTCIFWVGIIQWLLFDQMICTWRAWQVCRCWWSISLIKSTSRRPCWLAFASRAFSWGYPTLLGKMWTGIQRPPKFCGTNNWFWGKPPGVSSKSLENHGSLQEKTAELFIYFTLRFCDINGLDRKSEHEMIDVDGFPCLRVSRKENC